MEAQETETFLSADVEENMFTELRLHIILVRLLGLKIYNQKCN